jgi:hypothetical protein
MLFETATEIQFPHLSQVILLAIQLFRLDLLPTVSDIFVIQEYFGSHDEMDNHRSYLHAFITWGFHNSQYSMHNILVIAKLRKLKTKI